VRPTLPEPAPLRLTGTLVAQFFRSRCDRQLRYEMVPAAARGDDVPAHNRDRAAGPVVGPRPGMKLLARAGRRWERRKVRLLLRRFGPAVRFSGWEPDGTAAALPYAEVVALLRDPGEVRFLVQPQLRLPDPGAFARRYGIGAGVEIAPAQPDVIRVGRTDDGRPLLSVLDVKGSREGSIRHYAQVAFYTLLLEEICRAEGVDAVVDARHGWLWTPAAARPVRFALGAYRHHVEAFLRDDLPRIAGARADAADWHLAAGCASCAFFQHCRAEADAGDHLSRVPGLTPLAARLLRERGIDTVRALSRTFRRDVYTGCHALESGETALRRRVQALSYGKVFEVGRATHRMPGGDGPRIVLTAEGDPVTGRVFALGARADGFGHPAAEALVADAGTAAAEGRILAGLLAHVLHLLRAASAATDGGPSAGVRFYVYDRRELELLRDLVHRHLGDPGAQPGLAGLAALLSPGGRPPAGAVVRDALEDLYALPVPYAWDLPRVSRALPPSSAPHVHRPRGPYGWPLSSQVAFERIHDVWAARPLRTRAGGEEAPDAIRAEIRATVLSKLAAIDSVLRALHERSARRGAEALRPYAPAAPGGDPPIADPVLESLRLFVEVEAAAAAAVIGDLHALPTAERARRFECIAGMERVEVREDGRAVFEFDPEWREAKFRPGDFALVLTNDDGRTLPDVARKPWLRRKLAVELVEYDLSVSPPRLVLASEYGFETLEREKLIDLDRVCVLDRAGADHSTRRLTATLRALAAGHGEAAHVLGLLRGEPPPPPASLDAAAARARTLGAVEARTGRAVLNPEQEAAWAAAFERAVTVVWGPPGTGKTYLLAWMLIGLAAAARDAGRPLRVLVAAATHRAIVNVLARLARELEAAGLDLPVDVVKLEGRGSEADRDLQGLDAALVDDRRLPALLAGAVETGIPLVVGSTVWSLWKQMRAMDGAADDADAGAGEAAPVRPLFDVVVLDEASQMKVPEALVALSSLRRGGRVILAGDDRQLPPILRGRYPEDETLFGSAFSHFAAAYGRQMLRESRRMNEPLTRFPRRAFYPGLFSEDPARRLAVARALPPGADPVDAILHAACFDPAEAVVLLTYAGVRATARNAFEAELAARIATLARACLVDPETGEGYRADAFRARALALIAPHRAQNSAILGELAVRGWAHDELPVVDTVERMQGNEREMVVVSYGVADREYAEREAEFLLHPHRFNVSVTRPRAKLVLLLSDDVLRAVPREERAMTASSAMQDFVRGCGDPRRVRLAAGGVEVEVTVRTVR
jgi:DNA replication ATP-dependent helicase Dna2